MSTSEHPSLHGSYRDDVRDGAAPRERVTRGLLEESRRSRVSEPAAVSADGGLGERSD